MRIEHIEQHRDRIATLASWHHARWGHLFDDWTLAAAIAELHDHASRRELPTTLVLLEGDLLLGSVSLLFEDAPELDDFGSPWLASLYVVPEARGQGLGAALVNAAVELAAQGGVSRLYLFTPEHAAFYQRLGWRPLARTQVNAIPVDVMVITTEAKPMGAQS